MITVFTPTYNRRKLLERCFKSLNKQTNKKFEWLVVDDGSNDDTREYIESIKKKADFKISYIYQENGGKKNCKTEYFLILDSDDILDKKCIEILNRKIELIEKDSNISGIIGNKFDIKTKRVIGVKLPHKKYLSGLELYQKYHFHGDTLRLYKTSILKENLFPEIVGENFISENVVFDKIDQKFRMLLIDDRLYYSEYQENGYSNNINKIRKNNPIGYSLSLKSTAETALTLKKKLGITILYIMWNRHFKIKNTYNFYRYKIRYVICLPVSYIFEILKIPKFFFQMFRG